MIFYMYDTIIWLKLDEACLFRVLKVCIYTRLQSRAIPDMGVNDLVTSYYFMQKNWTKNLKWVS